MSQLRSLLLTLHELRQAEMEQGYTEKLETAYQALRATPEFAVVQELSLEADRLEASIKSAKKAVVEEALLVWKTSKDKHPAPGVEIRVSRRAEYDQQDALAYCLNGMNSALQVDNRVFSAFMLQLEKSSPMNVPGFVCIAEDPIVAVSNDLAKFAPELILSAEEPEQGSHLGNTAKEG